MSPDKVITLLEMAWPERLPVLAAELVTAMMERAEEVGHDVHPASADIVNAIHAFNEGELSIHELRGAAGRAVAAAKETSGSGDDPGRVTWSAGKAGEIAMEAAVDYEAISQALAGVLTWCRWFGVPEDVLGDVCSRASSELSSMR